MTNTAKVIVAGIGGLILGVIISPVFGVSNWGMMSGNSMMGSNRMGNIDRHFIEEMIPHHEGAIDMAKLALDKSKRPEIISLANGIIEAQQREIVDMRRWYQDWFGQTVPVTSQGMMGGGGMVHMGSTEADLESLAAAKDFDLEFIRQMVPHHQMAVTMARMLRSGTDREEMEVLADQIITSQTKEIEMMRSWAKGWM